MADDEDTFEGSTEFCDQCGKSLPDKVYAVDVIGRTTTIRITMCSQKCLDEFEGD